MKRDRNPLKAATTGLSALSAKLKWSHILGTPYTMNLFNVVAPVNGELFGRLGFINVIVADLILLLIKPDFTLLRILKFLPMILATSFFAELRHRRKVSLFAIPLILTFWLHPTGRQAWPFALLWLTMLLPMIRDNLLTRSLSVQFFDHAIGSLIFLFAYPIAPEVWIQAIPLAMVERLLMAGGLTAVVAGIRLADSESHSSTVLDA